MQEEELQGLLKVAEALKVKGLVDSEDSLKGAASAKRIKSLASSKSSGGKQPIWPVTTSKLLSPNKASKTEADDDPGTLVIDEESNEANVTMSPLDTDYDMGYLNEDTPPAPGMVKTIGPNGKVEWKRYKQYTKDDILAAIEEVKNGENPPPSCPGSLGARGSSAAAGRRARSPRRRTTGFSSPPRRPSLLPRGGCPRPFSSLTKASLSPAESPCNWRSRLSRSRSRRSRRRRLGGSP